MELGSVPAVHDGKVIGTYFVADGKDAGAFDQIPELSDITGKIIVHQDIHRSSADSPYRHLEVARRLRQKQCAKCGDVFPALAQRRDCHWHDRESIVEIVAEETSAHALVQIAMGCDD